MNNILTFAYGEHSVRVCISHDGEFWFCLSDVCHALGLKSGRKVVKRRRLTQEGISLVDVLGSWGTLRALTFINEPNFYRVVFPSDKPGSHEFQDWVCRTVLPNLRQAFFQQKLDVSTH